MTEVYNISIILYSYLQALSVKVSRSTVHRLLDTPFGDSMRGISDALDMLHVKNEVYQLPSHEYFSQLEAPFITMLEVDKNPFCVVTKKDDSIVEYSNEKGVKQQIEVDKFLQSWSGTVLFGEPTIETHSDKCCVFKDAIYYLLQYKIVIALLLVLALGLQIAFRHTQQFTDIAYMCTLVLGIFVSAAILYKERMNNHFLERFCHIGNTVDCNEVLHSKGASIAGVGLGELSLLYFAVLYLFALIRWNDFYGISVICCMIAMAFTVYSIIFQAFVLHKCCMLCMLVNVSIWGNAVTLYLIKNDFVISTTLSALFAFVAIGCICIFMEVQLRAIQVSERERIMLKSFYGHLLNPETFQTLLMQKPQIGKMIDRNIALHNLKTGSNELMIVTNPNCKNCARVHHHIKEMASTIPVSLVLVTFPNDKLGEKVAQVIIAAYYIFGWYRAMELLGEWFETRNIKEVDKYGVTSEVRDVWVKQQLYCQQQGIRKTPSVIVNKHFVPEMFPLSDLRYVLT